LLAVNVVNRGETKFLEFEIEDRMNRQEIDNQETFHTGDLVIWHERQGKQIYPIPAVVVRQESDCVCIRAHIEGTTRELRVDPQQLEYRS